MSLFGDLVNIEEFDKRDYFSEDRGDVAYYCKDCKKLVEVDRPNPEAYDFICKRCEGTHIVLGTTEGLKTNYRIKS